MPGRASGSGSSSRDNRSAVEGPHGAPGGIADRRAPGISGQQRYRNSERGHLEKNGAEAPHVRRQRRRAWSVCCARVQTLPLSVHEVPTPKVCQSNRERRLTVTTGVGRAL